MAFLAWLWLDNIGHGLPWLHVQRPQLSKVLADKAAEESDAGKLSSRTRETQIFNLAPHGGTEQFNTSRVLPRAPPTDACGLADRFYHRAALSISQGAERHPKPLITCGSVFP